VCKEEEEAIRVDLHEGCGRTKLFWLLALADKATLQALVEFRDVASNPTDLSAVPAVARANVQLARVGVCRYCGMVSNDGLLAIGNVCANDECQVSRRDVLRCYHRPPVPYNCVDEFRAQKTHKSLTPITQHFDLRYFLTSDFLSSS